MKIVEGLENEIKEINYLDYTNDYKYAYIRNIKQDFKAKCLKDDTLSEEYLKHISDLDNIEVELKYGYELNVRFLSIDVNVGYSYRYSYKSGEYVTGTLTKDFYGDYKLSNTSTHSEYSTSTFYGNTDVYIHKKGLYYPCVCVGNGHYDQEKEERGYYKSYSFKNMPPYLREVYDNTTITVSDFEKKLKKYCTDSPFVREQIDEFLKRDNPKYVGVNGFTDYSILDAKLYFLPSGFVIKTAFNGKTYKEEFSSVEQIKSFGENSKNFELFERTRKSCESEGTSNWVSGITLCASLLLSIISFLGMLFDFLPADRGWVYSVAEANCGCGQQILYFLFFFGPGAVTLLIMKLYTAEYKTPVKFDKEADIRALCRKVEAKHKKSIIAKAVFSVIYLLLTLLWYYMVLFA